MTALDEADRLLIRLADRAERTGVGHSFNYRGGTVKVLAVDARYLRLETSRAGVTERLDLPRDIRTVAMKAAFLQGRT